MNVSSDNFELTISYESGVKHIYRYNEQDKAIYYVVNDVNSDIDKFITLCSEIENCIFTLQSDNLNLQVMSNGIVYTNNFSI